MANEWVVRDWQMVINQLAARLGAPVFLVGSALTKEDPHDFDLRVTLGEPDMLRLFGEAGTGRTEMSLTDERTWRQCYEQLKQSRRLSRMLGKNIDFQIQSEKTAAGYAERDRVRLDMAPDGFFDAGVGDA